MTFRPLISTNSTPQNYGQINDMVRSLNKEQQVKVFKGSTGKPAVIIGKYNDDEYGISFYNNNGVLVRTITGLTNTTYYTNGQESSINDGTTTTTYYPDGTVSSTNNGTTTTKYDTDGVTLSVDNGDRTVYYDASDSRILIGKAPNDGRLGIWVSNTGVDVITELS